MTENSKQKKGGEHRKRNWNLVKKGVNKTRAQQQWGVSASPIYREQVEQFPTLLANPVL
jgi:hypothetical protein